ncbi:hypothetical protein D3C74_492500 [compost metagenome]
MMHPLGGRLLHTTTLMPEIDTAVSKHNETLITRLNRKRQRDTATARENDRNVQQ